MPKAHRDCWPCSQRSRAFPWGRQNLGPQPGEDRLPLAFLSFLTLSQKSYLLAAPPTNPVPSYRSTFSASILCFVQCRLRAHVSLTLSCSHSPLTSTLERVSCSAVCSLPHFQKISGNSGSCIPRALWSSSRTYHGVSAQ